VTVRVVLMLVGLGLGGCAGGDKSGDSAGAEGSSEGGDGGSGSGGADDADGDGVAVGDDCDDTDAAVFPGAPERCNGIDDDCDGALPAGEQSTGPSGALLCAPCEEAGFYAATLAHPDDDGALWDALADALEPVECSYSRSQNQIYTSLDLQGAEVECVYTGTRVAILGGDPEDGALNIEHTWPRSEGAESEPALCDVHHLFPTTTTSNAERESHPFGEVTGSVYWSQGGSQLGQGSGGTVFEPRDVHKGNVARALLYVKLRYGHGFASSEQSAFAAWSASDPVDAAELDRSLGIGRYQGQANPFVVCDGLAERFLD
jgi:endonuclease I